MAAIREHRGELLTIAIEVAAQVPVHWREELVARVPPSCSLTGHNPCRVWMNSLFQRPILAQVRENCAINMMGMRKALADEGQEQGSEMRLLLSWIVPAACKAAATLPVPAEKPPALRRNLVKLFARCARDSRPSPVSSSRPWTGFRISSWKLRLKCNLLKL